MPVSQWSPAKRGLYVMSKPPPPILSRMSQLDRMPPQSGLERLHATLLALGDLAELPEGHLPAVLEAMDGFHADAFHMYFDYIVEGEVVALRSRKKQRGADAFRKHLVRFLQERDFHAFVVPGKAHVTLRYDRDGKGDEPIQPIDWRVDEVLLIESLGGKSTHVERGRWQLDPLLI